jgi:hypothetical protein
LLNAMRADGRTRADDYALLLELPLRSRSATLLAYHYVAGRVEQGRARDDGTAITTIFTGRPARSIINRIMRDLGRSPSIPPGLCRHVALDAECGITKLR